MRHNARSRNARRRSGIAGQRGCAHHVIRARNARLEASAARGALPRAVCGFMSVADRNFLETPTVAAPAPPELSSRPIKNLRITFWGVQGSCPIFPTGREVTDYARRIANATIERAMGELAGRAEGGELNGAETFRQLASSDVAAAEFVRKIGLPDLPVYGG